MLASFKKNIVLLCVTLLVSCNSVPIEQVPSDAVVVVGPSDLQGKTREQIEADEKRLADNERTREPSIRTDYPALTRIAATAPAVTTSGFPQPPGDSRSDCDDPNSRFVQWIQNVQQRASSGGACMNARGAYLINSEGAKKSRYCAQFYSGTEREKSLQQADEYDRVANEARGTMGGSCG
ncbi:hypothetical protein ASE04_04825 [Rhizobium sp. Root708]|uniref:hypothetical protein n=1 Tax=Rhizobium sp. Root708 TaxID=1736592 RepID=UPI0007003580|nr:hypothetical protein [Rhizobium sp. Root708]KRB55054.1 hypothetical protein ASE04_04825 [Rhizobium sp. Root708]